MKIRILIKDKWIKSQIKELVKEFPMCTFSIENYNGRPTYEKRGKNTYISDEYLNNFVKDYDGVFLIGSFPKITVRGNHHVENGKSLMHMHTEEDMGVELRGVWGAKYYKDVKGTNQLAYTFKHEMGHALSKFNGVQDLLHTFVKFGKFDAYYTDYLFPKITGPLVIKDLQPRIKRDIKQFQKYAAYLGVPFRVTEGYRSNLRQSELYAQGRTKPGRIVTNAKPGESLHNYGVAFDVVPLEGYNIPERKWLVLGTIGKLMGYEWGGDWESFIDKPHFELTFDYTLEDFQKERVNYRDYS